MEKVQGVYGEMCEGHRNRGENRYFGNIMNNLVWQLYPLGYGSY